MRVKRIFQIGVSAVAFVLGALPVSAQHQKPNIYTYEVADFGLKPNSSKNASPVLQRLLKKIKAERSGQDSIVIRFGKGTYQFHEKGAAMREYYISNHDQTNPKLVGIPLEDMNHLALEGEGAEFVFHGQMLPVSLLRSSNCTLRNFSIDFANPHISR